MKKFLAFILIISSLLGLCACADDDGIPTGMQIIRSGEDVGYSFYAPEEWTVANLADISAAYVSRVNLTSVSYTEITPPEVSTEEYFASSLSEFPAAPIIHINGESTALGNSESALKYVYDYTYSERSFRVMQIFARFEGRFGIFTYTSYNEKKSESDEETQYEYYMKFVQSVIENFKFLTKSSGATAPTEYETDADGYRLVSDKAVADFELYLPEEFEPDYSSGIVSATASDGSNITMTKPTATGVVVSEYWEKRKTELSAIVTNLTVVDGHENRATTLGNSEQAFSYEYTYEYNGKLYHVYQILAVEGFDGYVFTYTAAEENYASHIDTVNKIIKKVIL